jgi:hypothetical protein
MGLDHVVTINSTVSLTGIYTLIIIWMPTSSYMVNSFFPSVCVLCLIAAILTTESWIATAEGDRLKQQKHHRTRSGSCWTQLFLEIKVKEVWNNTSWSQFPPIKDAHKLHFTWEMKSCKSIQERIYKPKGFQMKRKRRLWIPQPPWRKT